MTIDDVLAAPFIKLDIPFDKEALLKEYNDIISTYEFKPYQTQAPFVKNKYAKSWSGICLQSSDGGLYTDMSEGATKANLPTELLLKCPTIQKLLADLKCKARARVMRIAPKSSLVWHSHCQEHGQTVKTLTVQIPLSMPDDFTYCVVNKDEFRWWKRFFRPSWFKTLKTAKFDPGEAFVFNSYHYHNVYNNSDQPRDTLMLYVDLYTPTIWSLVSRGLNK